MKKIIMLLLTVVILTSCSDSNNSSPEIYQEESTTQCGTMEWEENGRCCKATGAGYVNSDGECPRNLYPGYEIPTPVNSRGCYSIQCR